MWPLADDLVDRVLGCLHFLSAQIENAIESNKIHLAFTKN